MVMCEDCNYMWEPLSDSEPTHCPQCGSAEIEETKPQNLEKVDGRKEDEAMDKSKPNDYVETKSTGDELNHLPPDSVLGEVPSGSLCEICRKEINDLKGNPDFWGVALPYQDGNGKMKYYHRGCVANIIARHLT